jgi:hypothetical protein
MIKIIIDAMTLAYKTPPWMELMQFLVDINAGITVLKM